MHSCEYVFTEFIAESGESLKNWLKGQKISLRKGDYAG